jgi:hypothetical protein
LITQPRSFVNFLLLSPNPFIYLQLVFLWAKSRINNVCVSFLEEVSCNNRFQDFTDFTAHYLAAGKTDNVEETGGGRYQLGLGGFIIRGRKSGTGAAVV